jgi:hypothetical protein
LPLILPYPIAQNNLPKKVSPSGAVGLFDKGLLNGLRFLGLFDDELFKELFGGLLEGLLDSFDLISESFSGL